MKARNLAEKTTGMKTKTVMKARNLAETKTAETKALEDCDKAAETTEKAT